MAPHLGDEDWRSIAEQTGKENGLGEADDLGREALPSVRGRAQREVSVGSRIRGK